MISAVSRDIINTRVGATDKISHGKIILLCLRRFTGRRAISMLLSFDDYSNTGILRRRFGCHALLILAGRCAAITITFRRHATTRRDARHIAMISRAIERDGCSFRLRRPRQRACASPPRRHARRHHSAFTKILYLFSPGILAAARRPHAYRSLR